MQIKKLQNNGCLLVLTVTENFSKYTVQWLEDPESMAILIKN